MMKFKDFCTLGEHVNNIKKDRVETLISRLKDGILVKDLSHFNKNELSYMVNVGDIHHLDYIFENKERISQIEWNVVESMNWNTFVMIATLIDTTTNNTITISSPFFIHDMKNSDGFRIEIPSSFLQESFVKETLKKEGSQEAFELIELNHKMFGAKMTLNHRIHKKNILTINETIEYIEYYEFFTKTRVQAGVSKHLAKKTDTLNDNFFETVRFYLETEYTNPILNKTIDELTEDDITVIAMYNI